MSAQPQQNVEYVSVENLHFDPNNPRLPIKLRGAGENEVFAFLLRECNLVELMLSIGAQGFFAGEPLLCAPDEAGRLIVVEGNRRLAATKLLSNQADAPTHLKQVAAARESATYKPTSLPVIKFEKRDQIITYLGYRHITGVNQWGALEKARYLKQLADHYGDKPDKFKLLAREIGSRADYVAQMLTALSVVERANDNGLFERFSINPDAIPFSVLTTALSYNSLSEFLNLSSRGDVAAADINDEHLEEFFKWLFVESEGRTRLGESRNLRVLARVVSNKEALDKFRSGGTLSEADLFTEGPLLLLQKTMQEIESKFSIAQEAVRNIEVLSNRDFERAKVIERASRNLRLSVEVMVAKD